MADNDDWLDPQLAWKDLREAFTEGNLDDMASSAGELLEWLDQGGRPPQTSADPLMNDDWHRLVARAVCRVIQRAAARGICDRIRRVVARVRGTEQQPPDTKGSLA